MRKFIYLIISITLLSFSLTTIKETIGKDDTEDSSKKKSKKNESAGVDTKDKKGDKKELGRLAASHIAYRKQKHPLEYPSAGSVFKNVDFKKIPARFQTVFLDKVKKDPFL